MRVLTKPMEVSEKMIDMIFLALLILLKIGITAESKTTAEENTTI